MVIGLMNERITIQNTIVISDEIGNHTNSWEDYYDCACTVGGEYGVEKEAAGQVVEPTDISFTVRACALTESVNEDSFRIHFRGKYYNIVSIDHMNYKHKCIKYRCRRISHEDSNG